MKFPVLKVTSTSELTQEPVTVRIFGPNTEIVIDRKKEFEVCPYSRLEKLVGNKLNIFATGLNSLICSRLWGEASWNFQKWSNSNFS